MFLPLKDHNPTQTFPAVTVALIGVNLAVWFWEVSLGSGLGAFLARWGATPYEIVRNVDLVGQVPGGLLHVEGPRPIQLTLLTSMFLHGGWAHVLFNMLFLWIFGNNVEDFLGWWRFLLFYLAAGVLGSLLHIALSPDSVLPTVGASGAISGMLGAYLVLYPRARVRTLIFLGFFFHVTEVPAILLITLWTGLQVVGGLIGLTARDVNGGVAYWAHLGGFAAGWVGLRFWFREQRQRDLWRSRWRQLDGQVSDRR